MLDDVGNHSSRLLPAWCVCPAATWELRCGKQNQYRILYDITSTPDSEAANIIEILGIIEVIAIGEKRQEKLFIQGREVST